MRGEGYIFAGQWVCLYKIKVIVFLVASTADSDENFKKGREYLVDASSQNALGNSNKNQVV